MVGREKSFKKGFKFRSVELGVKFLNAQVLGHFPEHDFEEGSRGRSGCIAGYLNDLKDLPVQCLSVEEMSEELGKVANFIGFVLENSMEVLDKCFDEVLLVHVVQLTESLRQ